MEKIPLLEEILAIKNINNGRVIGAPKITQDYLTSHQNSVRDGTWIIVKTKSDDIIGEFTVEEYEQYKIRACKGDALIYMIARDVLLVNWRDKHVCLNAINNMASNNSLSKIASEFNIEVPPFDGSSKKLANAYEEKIWRIFQEEGYDSAVEFYKRTVLTYFSRRLGFEFLKTIL